MEKTVDVMVRATRCPTVQKAIEGYRLFQQLVEQYAQQVIYKTREEMATGSKKNTDPEILWAQESEIQQLINPGKKRQNH